MLEHVNTIISTPMPPPTSYSQRWLVGVPARSPHSQVLYMYGISHHRPAKLLIRYESSLMPTYAICILVSNSLRMCILHLLLYSCT